MGVEDGSEEGDLDVKEERREEGQSIGGQQK